MSEVAGYIPCVLCWYQRIAMYPLVVILGVAVWRRDAQVWRTVVPIAAARVGRVGLAPGRRTRSRRSRRACDPAAPCAVRWVEEFGFLTLPGWR